MQSVLILGNDSAMWNTLEKIIREINRDIIIYRTGTLAEAYQIAMEHNISLFLSDIIIDVSKREDVSGLTFIENIRKLERYAFVPVIFVTTLSDPKMYAYSKLHCYGYLQKPVLSDEAKPLIEQALKFKQSVKEEGNIYFRRDGVIYAVDKKEIIYIKSHAGKVTIKTEREELVVYYRTCRDILLELDSDRFIQCNRGTIVNKTYIANLDVANRVLNLINNYGELEVSMRMKKKLLEQMQQDFV